MHKKIIMTSPTSEARRSLIKAAALIAMAPAAALAKVKPYPAGPVNMMVPYPAGGPSDVSARILSRPIGQALGTQVVVENLGGATGTIAAAKVLNGNADGSTFFQGTQNELILPPLTNSAVRYEPSDFESLQPITATHLVLLVPSNLPVDSTESFLKYAAARAADQPLTYGSVGVGSLYHLITDYMGKILGLPFTHVPYRGTAPVVQDLAGGQIDFSIMPFQASMLAMIAEGRYKALAVLTKNKPAVLADIPSITEVAGLENFEYASYAGYFVKKGTPQDIKVKLNQAIGAALRNREVIDKLEADGRLVSAPMTLEASHAAYTAEIAKYREMIRVTGFVQTD